MNAETMSDVLEQQSLPPPEILAQYEQLVPGAGERLLGLAAEQQKHRFEVEKAALLGEHHAVRRGQIFALLLSLLTLGGGFYLSVRGIEVPGVIMASTSLFLCLAAFAAGRSQYRPD